MLVCELVQACLRRGCRRLRSLSVIQELSITSRLHLTLAMDREHVRARERRCEHLLRVYLQRKRFEHGTLTRAGGVAVLCSYIATAR